MTAENPLTSIDVMSDGATVAVGSTRGIIYLYDLRHGNAPMKTINAHKSSVQNVKFQHGLVVSFKNTGNWLCHYRVYHVMKQTD